MEIKTAFTKVSGSVETAKVFKSILNTESEIDKNKEHFWVMGLNSNNSIVYVELATLGIIDQSIVAPRETYRLAIMKGVSRIIVCHNHPSSTVRPSSADNETTKMLKNSGDIIGIELLDHIIINNENEEYYSFAEHDSL